MFSESPSALYGSNAAHKKPRGNTARGGNQESRIVAVSSHGPGHLLLRSCLHLAFPQMLRRRNTSGFRSVYWTVCSIETWPSHSWMTRVGMGGSWLPM